MGLFADRVQQLGTENAFRIGTHVKQIEAQGHHVIKCNLGEPDFPLPRHIAEEAAAEAFATAGYRLKDFMIDLLASETVATAAPLEGL